MKAIHTEYGTIAGVTKGGYTVYKGIPYAKPPTGRWRFKPPVKPEAWEGIRHADSYGPGCLQSGRKPGSFYHKEFESTAKEKHSFSEDCLYLNIWTPDYDEKELGEKLPVALWIHGGAFLGGSGSEISFDGEAYVKRGVILVTINYRLGVFGFLCHPLLTTANESPACGNYGLLDQIAALKWVKENIAAFGGDPEKITVFGQSAGAMSTQKLVLSPLSQGLVQHAIMQSGGGYRHPMHDDRSLEAAYETGKAVFAELGISEITDADEILEKLYTYPAEVILEAAGRVIGRAFETRSGLPFVPVIDHYVLMDGDDCLLEQGRQAPISYLLGSNAQDIMVTEKEQHCPEKSGLHKACAAWSLLASEQKKEGSYVYYFQRQLPGDGSGAFHSAELWYMFGTLERSWRPFNESDRQLSEQMLDYWCNFIKTGNPNSKELGEWRPYTQADPYYKVFDADEVKIES